MSEFPLLFRLVLPKVAVPVKNPVTYKFPYESAAIPFSPVEGSGASMPSSLTTHCHEPLLFNLAKKMSSPPLPVRLVLPKVAVPEKDPVT